MDTRSFHANTVREALSVVKSQLGEEAEILDTRILGSGAERRIEVRARASLPAGVIETLSVGSTAAETRTAGAASAAGAGLLPTIPVRAEIRAAEPAVPADGLARELERVARNVEGFRESLSQITWLTERFSLGVLSDAERSSYQALRSRGVDTELALSILTSARSSDSSGGWLRDRVLAVLGQQISVVAPPPAGRRCVALVGPPGAGKTTLIAKLAAEARLEGIPSLHLVTTDLFRVGGASELTTYGKLLGVPVHVLREPEPLARMIERNDRGWILVDTSGRAPDDPRQRALLEPIVAARDSVEVHLAMPVPMKPSDQLDAARRWSWLTPDRVALTHADESATPGSVLATLRDLELPVSYVSSSSTVPGGFTAATSEALALWMLGESV